MERYADILERSKESLVLEGHLMSDHLHMLISIPPKYPVCVPVCRANGTGRQEGEKRLDQLRMFE